MVQLNLFTTQNILTDIEDKFMVTRGKMCMGRGRDKLRPAVEHRELYSTLCNNLYKKRI